MIFNIFRKVYHIKLFSRRKKYSGIQAPGMFGKRKGLGLTSQTFFIIQRQKPGLSEAEAWVAEKKIIHRIMFLSLSIMLWAAEYCIISNFLRLFKQPKGLAAYEE